MPSGMLLSVIFFWLRLLWLCFQRVLLPVAVFVLIQMWNSCSVRALTVYHYAVHIVQICKDFVAPS